MATANSKRKRTISTRRKSHWNRGWDLLKGAYFWQRFGICVAATLLIWGFTEGWQPPFSHRVGDYPDRDLYARVDFSYPDDRATVEARQQARSNVLCYYENNPKPLEELRDAVADRLFRITGAADYEAVDKSILDEFIAPGQAETNGLEEERQRIFEELRSALGEDSDGSKTRRGLEHALLDHIRKGLLKNLEHDYKVGSTQTIYVYPSGNPRNGIPVEVSDVRIQEVTERLRDNIYLELSKEFSGEGNARTLTDYVYAWFQPRLPTTLHWNEEETEAERERVAREVPQVFKEYRVGQRLERRRFEDSMSRGIDGGTALTEEDLDLLRAEHEAFVANRSWWDVLSYVLAGFGMYAAVFTLCGFYLHYRDRRLLMDIKQLAAVLATASVTICVVYLLAIRMELWQGELVPLVMFTMTISIAYRQELGFLLTAMVSFVATMTMGQGLSEFVIMVATSSAAALLSGTIRSRTRLVYVGLIAAFIGFPTAIGVNVLDGDPLGRELLVRASWIAFSAVLAGLLMTALLPFLERFLNLETDISLLEIGDAAHPLLQELVRRAPGTYNHSINVASIAEAAADAIGANGLLCRVGAYFHDIGKMLKPEYFVENQGQQGNKHESLVPAMSTLVIIAHVKDGVELAKEHHLPRRIIDLIEQHHGTTLVEYFYLRATKKCEETGENVNVDESSFRYPGPKPQTPEAAVMMLADAVESASRTLVDPAPARIESLVHEISRKKLDDRQFDECSLTLRQIKQIEESLIKSLTAVYHGRVKYPDQASA